jgi:hypothetical protein
MNELFRLRGMHGRIVKGRADTSLTPQPH